MDCPDKPGNDLKFVSFFSWESLDSVVKPRNDSH